jgi:hypothetical protein
MSREALWNRHGLGTSSGSDLTGQSKLYPWHNQAIGMQPRSYPASCSGLLPRISGRASSEKGVKRYSFGRWVLFGVIAVALKVPLGFAARSPVATR